MSPPGEDGGHWTLLTGHGHVLVEIARDPTARIRDIVTDVETVGYLTRTRTGPGTVYAVNTESGFRHAAQDGHRVGPFLDLLASEDVSGFGPADADSSAGPGMSAPSGPDHDGPGIQAP